MIGSDVYGGRNPSEQMCLIGCRRASDEVIGSQPDGQMHELIACLNILQDGGLRLHLTARYDRAGPFRLSLSKLASHPSSSST